ncbi:Beta-glucanase [Orbilia brochopaga]|nr:Beta-glucanase [Drechslerella brochopaga]
MKFQTIGALVASAALPVAFAQTWTKCNPMEKTCPCDPALGSTYTYDFRNGKDSNIFPQDKGFKYSYSPEGLHLSVGKKGDAPTITANKFVLGGKLECTLKIAPGKGIVSSLVFQSDDLDEIDFEWIGSKNNQAQSNYFGKGNTEQYNRGGFHDVATADTAFHKYTIDWTQTMITWSIDDKVVRTLTPAQSADLYGSNNFYPQTPMQIKIGAWAAGDPSNAKGTVEWADGPINYGQGPFDMVIQSLTLTDYSAGATEYCYGDKSGSWGSIKVSKDSTKSTVDNSDKNSKDEKNAQSSSSSASSKPTSTSSAASSSKPTTLSTSAKESTSYKPSTSATPTTRDIASDIMQGVPGATSKPVSSGTTAANSAAQTSAGAAAPPPASNSATSVRNAGFAGSIFAVFAALLL